MPDVVVAIDSNSPVTVAPQDVPGVAIVVQSGLAANLPAVSFPVTVPANAGGPLGGLRLVTIDDSAPAVAVYADCTIAEHAKKPIGMSRHAISPGETAPVVIAGQISDPSWSWTPGTALFLGANGMPVPYGSLPSPRAFDRLIGQVVDVTTIVLNVSSLSIAKA